jgi:hypothetical protein
MADIRDKEKGYNSDTESSSQQHAIFERPTGLKGLYYHPIVQVIASPRSLACILAYRVALH